MRRIEIVANKSVESEILEAIERALPNLRYTLISEVRGKGTRDKKLGTVTWPEMNFLLFSYADDADSRRLAELVDAIKGKFPKEGIKLFES